MSSSKFDEIYPIVVHFFNKAKLTLAHGTPEDHAAFKEEIAGYMADESVSNIICMHMPGIMRTLGKSDGGTVMDMIYFLCILFDNETLIKYVDNLNAKKLEADEEKYWVLTCAIGTVFGFYKQAAIACKDAEEKRGESYEYELEMLLSESQERYDLLKHIYTKYMEWHTGFEPLSRVIAGYLIMMDLDDIVAQNYAAKESSKK